MTWGQTRTLAGRYRCHYCNARHGRTTDHVIPKSLGGSDHVENFVPACAPCNSEKAGSLPTCRCDRCVAAICFHLDYIAAFHPTIRDALTRKVAPLLEEFRQRYTNPQEDA